MNTGRRFILLILLLIIFKNSEAQKTYTLIPKKTAMINKAVISSLPASLKGMAALYSAMGGTNCMDQKCQLTTALGLGDQGSEEQKNLITKYFPDDKVAKLVISQDCYLPPTSSSSFSNFTFLMFTVAGGTVKVDYQLDILEHGNIKKINGPDIYEYKNQVYKNKKRVLYAWTDK